MWVEEVFGIVHCDLEGSICDAGEKDITFSYTSGNKTIFYTCTSIVSEYVYVVLCVLHASHI